MDFGILVRNAGPLPSNIPVIDYFSICGLKE